MYIYISKRYGCTNDPTKGQKHSYFLTIAISTSWLALVFFLQGDSEPSQSEQMIGISGLFFISIVTVIEANLAFKKATNKTKAEKEKIISSNKKGWFN